MPGQPRRTTELMGSINRPSERKSRLAVPVRRTTGLPTSTAKRPQSVDRYSSRAYSLVPPASTAKKPRSHSQTPRSGFQTPTTPANRTPMSNSYLQSADKRGPIDDKLFVHQEAARITNFAIGQNVHGFGKDTKLRNVTYKQFTGLIEFMIEKLVGNRQPVQGIDDILKALHSLDYPYTINKSWLKTPTAGHAFNHVVLMLGWLLNLVEPPLMPNGETELDDFECINNLVHDGEFPTIMYQKVFMEKAKDGFKMWNLQEDEDFEKLNEELANMHVSQSTNGAIESIKRLDDDIISLEQEQKKLMTRVKPSTNHQKYMELERAVTDLRRILEGKQEIANQLMESLANERKTFDDKQKILKQREVQINVLRSKIQSQIMSKQEMKQLIQENYLLRQTLEAEQKSLEKLLEENVKEPVEVSQLVRQKVQKIKELNETMFMLAKNFEQVSKDFNPAEYELSANSPDILSQLESLKLPFQVVKKHLNGINEICAAGFIEVQMQNENISSAFENYQKKLKQATEKLALEMQTHNKTLSELEKKLADVNEKYEGAKKEEQNIKSEIVKVKADIETENAANTKVQEETQFIMKKMLEQQREILKSLREEDMKVGEKLKYYKGVLVDVKKETTQNQKEVLEKLKLLGYPK